MAAMQVEEEVAIQGMATEVLAAAEAAATEVTAVAAASTDSKVETLAAIRVELRVSAAKVWPTAAVTTMATAMA